MIAKVTRICKTCGKEYETCPNARDLNNPYRWQDVACSPECGAKYFYEVLVARGQLDEARQFGPQFGPKAPEEDSLPHSKSGEVDTAGALSQKRRKRFE